MPIQVNRFTSYLAHLLVIILLSLAANTWAQKSPTAIAGTICDNTTGEPLPFVQISVPASRMGTVSDINGRFDLTIGAADTLVQFRMVGYRPLSLPIPARGSRRMRVRLEPAVTNLQTVNVTAKRDKRERYTRRNNPAVELVQQVIDHKSQNHILSTEHFSRHMFSKLNMCLDQFHPDFEQHLFWKRFPFVEKYIDQAEFDGAEILHFSINEQMAQQEYLHGRIRTLTTANRSDGAQVNLSSKGLNDDLEVLFAPVDIYANDISLMSVRFISPLSTHLATTFYHFYITDTVESDGQRFVELSFVPSSKGNFGFVGSMLITLDSNYAVHSYSMRVPESVDLNFIRDLTILQSYELDSLGHHLPHRSDIYGRFYVGKRLRQIYVHQMHFYHQYAFDTLAAPLPDTLFGPLATSVTLSNAHRVLRKQWNAERPVQLSLAETFLDSMRYELMRIPFVRRTIHTGEALITGYVPTSSDRDSSRFDFGSIYNFISHNGTEGLRLRIGGMSTARLSNRNFFDGFLAYGFADHRPKFSLNLIHTFAPKRRFPKEWPLGLISLHAGYDIESPGLSFEQFDRDNILMWTSQPVPAQYVADLQLRLRKQWPSHIGIDTWVGLQHITPTGLLNYYRITPTGNERVDQIIYAQWAAGITFSPQAVARSSRSGNGSLLNIASNASSISLNHEMGYLDGFYYQRSSASIFSRLWLAAFGYIDLRAASGIVWTPVPMPKLFVPNGNASLLFSEGAFNTMRPMEFIMDRYVSLHATYHLKGLILNHLPIIKMLRLREVAGFNILYGGMSEHNIPSDLHPGLYQLPSTAQYLSSTPYMEYSVGIENIFKLIRIDYVRRLTYLQGIESPWAIKLSLRFTM
ncbi:MAG: DUF5686 and carboxypeptidase regulatory-like domain-containing protein [Bacteroidales bacterium]|nr:DUF5686 and carboxypeptidase regulatory-like domain-containing protein [Bacteroidales bacterium]